MKKTSLILTISVLLYGTSATYVLADEEIWPDEGSPPRPGMALPLGLEPFPVLPNNVKVDSSDPMSLQHHGMCEKSFQVTGNVMAEFPVEVTYVKDGIEYTETVQWQVKGDEALSGIASGTGWKLVQTGDTWSVKNPWVLTTTEADTTVKKIVLKPIDRQDSDNMKYAFDIGNPKGVTPDDEHTPGTSRGRPIQMQTDVSFTATYSKPVYTKAHAVKFWLTPIDGNNVHGDGDKPTHDLYGVLTIEFSPAVKSAKLDPTTEFLADTDCIKLIELAVNEAIVSSSMGKVNLTLLGEGSAYIQETDSASGSSSPMQVPEEYKLFVVDAGGRYDRDITDLVNYLKSDHCYRFITVNDNGKEESLPLEINGVDMPNNEYCHQ